MKGENIMSQIETLRKDLDQLTGNNLKLVLDFAKFLAGDKLPAERVAELKASVDGVGLEFPVRS